MLFVPGAWLIHWPLNRGR